jgi:hypothetical protein
MVRECLPPCLAPFFRAISPPTHLRPFDYVIQGRPIVLSADSRLPEIKERYPTYDGFLPCLAKNLSGGWIIDIGANVGDSLYSLLDAKNTRFVCVEPENEFFELLKQIFL